MDISLPNGNKVRCGNFSFVFDVSGLQRLHDRCVALEQMLKSDYDQFAQNYRFVLEEMALSLETQRRIAGSGQRYNEQTTRERITQEVKRDDSSYSDLLISLCLGSENISGIEELIHKQVQAQNVWNRSRFEEELVNYIRDMFRFGSSNSHSGEKAASMVPTNDLCREYFRKLFYLICAYFGHKAKFDGGLLPFRDYYPVPKKDREQSGIFLENRKQLYFRRREDVISYYLFVPADETIGDSQKRDIETIHRLWMDNMDSPQNVVNNPTFVSNKNGVDYRFWVYPLPSFPQSLTGEYIDGISSDERMQIIHGIVRGLASMHHAEPPFYHRALSPSAFLVCRIRNRPKPLLINFDCVKDTDADAQYTVFYAVNDRMADETPGDLFAPELYAEETLGDPDIDWSKADIYALGKTILKIAANSYDIPDTKPECLSEAQFSTLRGMCGSDISLRPGIDAVSDVF